MADVVPVIAATNHFSLGATFGTDSAEAPQEQQFDVALGATGNYLCSSSYDLINKYTQSGRYCGGVSPDIVTGLGTLWTAFGAVVNSKVPTSLKIGFEAGKNASYSIEGHQHAVNPHTTGMRVAALGTIIPASSGRGVPTLITVAGTCSPVKADVSIEIEHVDKPGATGDHFGGQHVTCKVTLSVDYEGTVTGVTAGSWLNVLYQTANANTDTPTSAVTAEQYVDLALPA